MKSDKNLKTAGVLLRELDKIDPTAGRSYWEIARRRGPRIRKFARYPRTLKKWQKRMNEPSHFSTQFRKIDEEEIREFILRIRSWLDDKDKHLIVAAINEILSEGKVLSTLGNDKDNTPGIKWNVVIGPSNLCRGENGRLAFRGPTKEFKVISDTEIPRGPWPQVPVLIQHSAGISIEFHFYNKWGNPVDITSFEKVFQSFVKTKSDRNYLIKCLRQLGFKVNVKTSSKR